MKISEISVRTIITKSNLPAADFVINPYVGCSHACRYCYARFMKRFTGHEEAWGSFVDAKVNAIDLIPESGDRYREKSIFMSSVTDPYLPQERAYGLTRRILEKLVFLEPRLGIQTKSDLIVRDIDILRQFTNCEAGLTITTLDDSVRKEVERGASSVSKRLSALKALHDAGIRTYAFIGPIMPGLTDWKAIIEETRSFTDFYMLENLNMAGGVRQSMMQWISAQQPDLVTEYEHIYGRCNDYWDGVEAEIRDYCSKQEIDGRIFFHHGRKA
ncbi:MAG: radical SAM protein [Spirochaetales bacterium]|nr:radical SAM protein [Spirochaetales bacterium]